MHDLPALWLPILVSAVAVFIASSLVHMVFKWHNSDYRALPNEDDAAAVLRAGNLSPGMYHMPHCVDMKDLQREDVKARFRAGPIALITVLPNGEPKMGTSLRNWFILNVVVSVIAGAITVQSLGLEVDHGRAGHLAGLIAFLTYGGACVQQSVWMGKPWLSTFKDLLDAFIYGTVVALSFMFLWPGL